ncbi:MAG: ROK family protein [Planctomycetota bacterium]
MGKKAKDADAVYAGIDIGGTKIYAVVTDAAGKVIGSGRKKTKAELGFEKVVKRAGKALKKACEEAGVAQKDLHAVGVGAPSPILPDGTAVAAPNMPGWDHVPLVPALRDELGVAVHAENDVNAGALGEHALGAGRGAETLVGFFMGTGLGGGIIHRGELLRGVNRMAAELGHAIVHVGGRRCGCGHDGCLEAYASKTGLGWRFHHEIVDEGRDSFLVEACGGDYTNVKSSILAKGWEAGDAVVREALEEACRYLGIGVANAITTLGPDCVVLGGGVFEALGDELLPLVEAAAAAHTHPPVSYRDTRLVLAELADDAVALGAMVYARECIGETKGLG